jgi:hypothetical protein
VDHYDRFALVKFVSTVIVLMALLVAPGQAANPEADTFAAVPANVDQFKGKSFLDHVRTTNAEEPSYSVPATFPGPLVAAPRREPDTPWTLLACFGLLLYLGRRRGKALGAAF